MNGRYGDGPVSLGPLDLSASWHEFMHYLYLPVRIPLSDAEHRGGLDTARPYTDPLTDAITATMGDDQPGNVYFPSALPKSLAFLERPIWTAFQDAWAHGFGDPYIYVTARRGFATPGNPLNRPGWHCDDFGGTDLNYIWSDVFPTRFLLSDEPLSISDDDEQSMLDMEQLAETARFRSEVGVEDGPVNELLRLTPWVIHNTPDIPAPGGMRSFFKISVSTHRYDLLGNSHNHLLRYDWPMVDRRALRNQPGGNRDYSGATP